MNRTTLHIIGLITLMLPAIAQAKTVTTWDFTDNFASQSWQANTNMQMTQTPQGVRFQPQQAEATLRRVVDIQQKIDVIRMWYQTPKDTNMKTMWSTIDSGDAMYVSPLLLEGDTKTRVLEIDYHKFDTWDGMPTSIGFWLPQNADVTLEKLELVRWNPVEKLGAMLTGLWHFDNLGPYSVNYVWGPRMPLNPVQNTQMFWTQPPGAESANWLMYFVLLASAAYIWIRNKPWRNFVMIIAVVWLVYDVRMGMEFFSYTYDDYKSYHSQEIGVRTFRDRAFFNDLADAITPTVQPYDKYIFVTENRWPYLGLIRYYTYPSIPTHPYDGNNTKYPIWVVYKRPDIQLSNDGYLVADGQVLSPKGKILHEFAPGSFVFQANL